MWHFVIISDENTSALVYNFQLPSCSLHYKNGFLVIVENKKNGEWIEISQYINHLQMSTKSS